MATVTRPHLARAEFVPAATLGSCLPTNTVVRALGLLTALGESSGHQNLSELAERTALSKSTAFRLLSTLRAAGMVDREGTTYTLGDRLVRLAGQAVEPAKVRVRDGLREVAMPFLQTAFVKSGGTVHLAVLDQDQVLYLEKLFGHRRVETPSRVGGHFPANASALGKALLAQSDEAAIDAALSQAVALTPNTICDPEVMYRELARIRRVGVAIDRDEARVGLSCVATAVRNPLGITAALSLSTETAAFRLDELAPLAQTASAGIERALYATSDSEAV